MAAICVIVPVYKVEPYLHRCVDSILAQTYSDFELILVDDGSPDNCGVICDEYAAKDSRVHVIHQENGGLSAARNAGIDWAFAHSDSSWLTFVDSDDWLHPRMLEALYNAVQKDGVSVAVCGYEETGGAEPVVLSEQLGSSLWTPDDFYVQHNCNAVIACGKLYEKCCFETLRYPVGKIHEDEYITHQILFRFPRISVIPAPLYAYFANAQGITKCAWTPKRLDVWEAYENQVDFFMRIGKPVLAERKLIFLLWNIREQINKVRELGDPEQYAWIRKQGRQETRCALQTAKRFGFSNVIAEHRKAVWEDLKVMPFVWKAEFEKKRGRKAAKRQDNEDDLT